MASEPASAPQETAIYEDFDAFLKSALHDYYRRQGRSHRGNFIALLIASGEITSMAMDSFKSGTGMKKLALGAAGVIALRIGLRYALSGPLGIILAGASAASLIAYFVRNRGEITSKIGYYRELVADLRQNYDKLQSDFRDSRFDIAQRNLMIDGLLQRFITDVDRTPSPPKKTPPKKAPPKSD